MFETEEASGFGIWADFVEEKRGVGQKLIWRKLEEEGLKEAGKQKLRGRCVI